MKTLSTHIIINAPTSYVWQVLMDHDHYSKWNPFISGISGEAKTGSTLAVEITTPGKKPMQFAPTVLVNQEQKEFRWLGHLFIKGLFDGEHFFMLEAISKEQTKLIHGEYFSGLLSSLILKNIGKETKSGFEAMNKALKHEAEQQYNQARS